MRKLVTLISAAAVAVTTAATAGVPQANAADSASSTREAKAISAAKSHAGATEFGAGQALQANEHPRRPRRHQSRAHEPDLPRPAGRRR